MLTWIGNKLNKHAKFVFALCVLALGIAALYYIYSRKLNYPVIRSDGEGYYAYLPALFRYHDITLNKLVQGPLHRHPPQGASIWDGTGKYLIKYPSGEAILMMPFYFFGNLVAHFSHQRLTGYSPPFQYAAAFSGLFYGVIGLLILWALLQRYFRQRTILIVLTGLLFGTNLFHYATYDAIFSHVYSFFLFAMFLYYVERVYRNNQVYQYVVLGLAAGLIVITRTSNAVWLLFGILFGIGSLQDARERLAWWKVNWIRLLLTLVACLAIISIQLVYWRVITGSFFVYSYGEEGFNFARPELWNVLFSVRKGLFFWSPILLAVFPGMFFVRKMANVYFVPILVFFPINVYIISSWTTWWYGGSFGMRPFVESLPMFAIALCALYEGLEKTRWKWVMLAGIVAACGLSIWLMLKYWFGSIPFEGITWKQLVDTFWQLRQ